METRKIVILGAGHVGTHCAVSLMFQELAETIVLVDEDRQKAESELKRKSPSAEETCR